MGLIINKKIRELMKGYPTISDKYDVAPAVLEGATSVKAGELVVFGSETGRYAAPTTSSTVAKIAGIVLATNVKVPKTYPATAGEQTYAADDAFNLMFRGAIAVELDGGATIANVVEGAKVAALFTAGHVGAFTTSGTTSATDIPDCYFTGIYENIGTAAAPKYLAEITYKL